VNYYIVCIRLAWLEFLEWLLPEPLTRCPHTEDGKHVYDQFTRANGFDGCIWCGRKREKGWME
jgi:hypothetical protein